MHASRCSTLSERFADIDQGLMLPQELAPKRFPLRLGPRVPPLISRGDELLHALKQGFEIDVVGVHCAGIVTASDPVVLRGTGALVLFLGQNGYVIALATVIEQTLQKAQALPTSGSANEANTKALLIEPLLAALGWDLADFDQLDHEYCVYDGTFLDYALKVDSKPPQ